MRQSALQPASQPEPGMLPFECTFQTIIGFLLPFFLVGAAGDPGLAGAAIVELIEAYGAATVKELDLAGRIIGFSTVAMDSLRLSMSDPDMPDAKILRYRGNAVALSRMAEQCRTVLDAMQAKRQQTQAQPGMAVAASTAAPDPAPVAVRPPAARKPPPAAAPARGPAADPAFDLAEPDVADGDIEAMRLHARRMIEALHGQGVAASAAVGKPPPDRFAATGAAAQAPVAAAGDAGAGIPRIRPAVTGTRC